MVNGLELLIVAAVSVGLGFTTATLWLDWDSDNIRSEGFTDGYKAAIEDARIDSGQTFYDQSLEPPF